MTDDFHLFDSAGDGDRPDDADIALITAYLARELSLVQIVAVEERLATDAAFRDAVQPIIAGWTLPRSFRATPSERPHRVGAPVLTRAQIEDGWQRHVAGAGQGATPTSTNLPNIISAGSSSTMNRRRQMTRIAAVIALMVLPLLTVAQAVVYIANHDAAPGHAMAYHILASVRGPQRATPENEIGLRRPTNTNADSVSEEPKPGSLPFALQRKQRAMPPRPLGSLVAASLPIPANPGLTPWNGVLVARQLADGRVLVDDPVGRQVLTLDSMLARRVVVFDSTNHRPNNFSYYPIVGFRGDSLLMPDYLTGIYNVVLNPSLRFVRALPLPTNVRLIRDGSERWSPAFGLLYEHMRPQGRICQYAVAPEVNCTGVIVAVNPDTRATDSLTTYYFPNYAGDFASTTDRWTVMSDGSVAILNGREYRVEWLNPDHSRTVGPRIPTEAKSLTAQERTRLADSVNTDLLARYQRDLANWRLDSADVAGGRSWTPRLTLSSGGVVLPAGMQPLADSLRSPRKAIANESFAMEASGRSVVHPSQPRFITASDIPDRIPPADRAMHALLADRDNRLWIRWGAWITAPDRPAVYDIVNRAGELVDRVQIPAGRTVIGFGPGGIVYLMAQGAGTYTVEKMRFK